MYELIVLIFIVIILILFLLHKTIPKMNGGEFTIARSKTNNEVILPSLSQISIISFPTKEQFIRNTKNEIRKRMDVNYHGEEFSILNKPKHLSDANYDLLMLFYNHNIRNGFAVCELCNKYRYDRNSNISYGNNLVTNIVNGDVTVDRIVKYDSVEVKTYVYIEFVYSDKGFKDFMITYERIHNETEKIINDYVIGHNGIFAFRIFVNDEGIVPYKEINIKDNIIHIYSSVIENTFIQLIIPSTDKNNGLQYDEYLEFETYSIQIEHSEGLGKHKSNILVFLLYSTKMKYCQERINKCLDALGYEKDNNIYRSSIKYNDSGKNRIIYWK